MNQFSEYYKSYSEVIIKKEKGPLEYLLLTLTVLGGAGLTYFMFALTVYLASGLIGMLFIAAGIYLTYLLILLQSVEYEYNFTMSELDVFAIYSKRKRKLMASIKCQQIENHGEYDAQKVREIKIAKDAKLINASSNIEGNKKYFLLYSSMDGRKYILVFEPSSEMLEAMIKQISRSR